MFLPIKYVDGHPLEKLNEVPVTFFKESLKATAYSYALFPNWFVPVLKSSRDSTTKDGKIKKGIDTKFKELFQEFKRLDSKSQKKISALVETNLEVKDLCENSGIEVLHSDYHENFHKKAYALFVDSLWNSTIRKNETLKAQLKVLLSDHYRSYLGLNNGRVCPFCALQYLSSGVGESKDSYDHWFHKSKYPIQAVNVKNLVRMCEKCNKSPAKGSEEVVFTDKSRKKRSTILYPYSYKTDLRITIKDFKRPDSLTTEEKRDFVYGRFYTQIKAEKSSQEVSVEMYKSVLNLEKRYDGYLSIDHELENKFHYEYCVNKPNTLMKTKPKDQREALEDFKKSLGHPSYSVGVKGNIALIDFIVKPGNEWIMATLFKKRLRTKAA